MNVQPSSRGFVARSIQHNGRAVQVETARKVVRPALAPLLAAAEAVFAPKVPVAPAANSSATAIPPFAGETPHQKVFRLVGERKFEEAAKLAASLINAGNDEGFFIYGGSVGYRQAESWFRAAVAAGKKGVSASVTRVTPEVAQVLLTNNDGNRRVNAVNLAMLMRGIADGEWEVNGGTLVVSREGLYNDGQHRAFAILLTGVPVRSLVSFGLTRDSMRTLDTGLKRTAKDRLLVAGVGNYSVLAGITSLVLEASEGRAPTPLEIDNYFHKHRQEIEAANKLTGTNMKGVGPSAPGAAALYLLRMGYDPERIHEFFKVVRTAEMTKKNDPRRSLHDDIFKEKTKRSRGAWLRAFVFHFQKWAAGSTQKEVDDTVALPKAF